MTGEPWTDDACSLVDAFRRGERSPREELEATLAAIAKQRTSTASRSSTPNARSTPAEHADVSRPFGGVPVGVKELEPVAGGRTTEASLVFATASPTHTSTVVERLLGPGRRGPRSGSPPRASSAGST